MIELNEEALASLIAKHLAGQLPEDQELILQEWAKEDPAHSALLSRISKEEELQIELERWREIDPAAGYSRWLRGWRERRQTKVITIASWAAAACLVIGVGWTWLQDSIPGRVQPAPAPVANNTPVLPGRNTAVLTLASGRQVWLDSASKGDLLDTQGGARVVKRDSGSLVYEAGVRSGTESISYNTLTTPRSGQYQLILPDGSHVWLNNISSVRYPTRFEGKAREVELTGEAYFEIRNDPSRPFIVKVNGEEITVLGTSFNIMAYPEEDVTQTTLVTGSVRVNNGRAMVQLQPDEQALADQAGGLKVVKGIPAEEVISWKDGFFYFGRADLKEVMRQLARWYDVEVDYEGKVPEVEFGGKIDRSLPLKDLLQYLDKNQVHFRLEGRKIIVLPS